MPPPDPFTPVPADAVVVGTGRLTLDVIIQAGIPPLSQAGGTCGNVLANLAYLGWQAYPLTDLGDDDPGHRFTRDLARWGVRLDLVRHLLGQESPVIVHHIRQTDASAVHSFSSRCPFCSRRLRYYEPVPLPAVEERLPEVPAARAFFFDRDSDGALALAGHCAARGAVVVFEPNYAGPETRFADALAVAHVLKFARDRLPERAGLELPGPRLIIETLGAAGLRYLDRRSGGLDWHHLPAFAVTAVRDAGGSGDWCTAGLIHLLARGGIAGFERASAEDVRAALRFGQALAAWNCAFEGARGGVYRVDRERFRRDVRAILGGRLFDPAEGAAPGGQEGAGAFCPRCRSEEGTDRKAATS